MTFSNKIIGIMLGLFIGFIMALNWEENQKRVVMFLSFMLVLIWWFLLELI